MSRYKRIVYTGPHLDMQGAACFLSFVTCTCTGQRAVNGLSAAQQEVTSGHLRGDHGDK